MVVRPLNGLVSITECSSRFEADAAVACLAASGIDAMVLADPAASVAPHLATERRFSVLVRIAIADDAQQALVRGRRAARPTAPPPLATPDPDPRPLLDHPSLHGSARPLGPAGGRLDEDALDGGGPATSLRRPRWLKPVAWATAASVVLPLVVSAVRALSEL